jgi:hypothetical protein
MNGPLVRQTAHRLLTLPALKNNNPREKIDAIYRILFQRLPNKEELRLALAYLTAQNDSTGDPSSQKERWVDYVHGLLMTNEFAFVD